MRFFRFLILQSRGSRLLLGAAVTGGAISGLSSVGLLASINWVMKQGEGADLTRAAWIFAALCAVVTVARIATQYLLADLGQSLIKRLRVAMSERILVAPLRQLERLGPHRLLATLTDDIQTVASGIIMVPSMTINTSIVLGALGYLAWLNWKLLLVMLVLLGIGILSYQLPLAFATRLFRQARDFQDDLFALFRGLTDGIKELKLHQERQLGFVDLISDNSESIRRVRRKAALIYGGASAWGNLLLFAVIGVLLFLRPGAVDAEWSTLVSYTVVLIYLIAPLQAVLDTIPLYNRADVAVEKVERLGLTLDAEAVEPQEGTATASSPSWSRVRLDGVRHSYHREGSDRTFQLGPIDLTLTPGEVLFLVGGNGSGKTTLAKVIVGLYAPEAGRILVDGVPVEGERLVDYRQLFSTVFADFYLFERFLGLEGEEREVLAREYLKRLAIDHKVEIRDGALTTTALSQGQRKRLALLTAYLEDRPIYLFDEWAADQDPVFKEVFYRQILPELRRRGKAVVVISHDDRYFDAGDRIVKLEDGQLRFVGTWEEMVEERSAAALGASA